LNNILMTTETPNSYNGNGANIIGNYNTNYKFPMLHPSEPQLEYLNDDQLSSTTVQTIMNNNELQLPQKVVIKATNESKIPMLLVKKMDSVSSKSHFKIGQDIVAIIQTVNDNNSIHKIAGIIDPVCNSDKIIQINDMKHNVVQDNRYAHISYSDHDYADKDIPLTKETTGVSKGLGPGLILTDEEKKLLESESLKLPEDAPLTKEEEKMLKKVRRKIKNKKSAMESRRKRKEYIENLERRVKHCTDLNYGLRKKVDKLTKENKSLVNQLKTMKEFIAASFHQSRTASTGTCLAVLLLSFALLVLPFNLFQHDGKHSSLPAETPNPTPIFRSRTLLTVDDNVDYVYQDNELNPLSNSIFNENYLHKLNVRTHFGTSESRFENEPFIWKKNISMYVHKNLTWHALLHDESVADNFVIS